MSHLGGASIAQVRIVRPDDDLCLGAEVVSQRFQRLGHMGVPQIPGGNSFVKHRAVILLGILHQASILFRKEECIPGDAAIAVCQIGSASAHFRPLANNFILAALAQTEAGGITVCLSIFAEVVEAGIAIPRTSRSLRIDFVQEIQHCLHGSMQAVEIQPIETNPLGMPVLIVIPQPTYKIENIGVAPHPGGKSLEARKRVDRIFVFTLKAHKLIDAICVRPICFYGDCGESLFRDQALGDLRAQAIELVGSMRSLSDENEPGVANHFEQRIEIRGFSRKRMCRLANRVNKIVFVS